MYGTFIMIKGLHHIGLYTTNMQKSLAFYTNAFGGVVTASFPMGGTGELIYMVEIAPGAVLELLPSDKKASEENGMWAHIAVLTDDIYTLHEKLLSMGATLKYDIAERDTMFHSFLYGAEGETIELYQMK